MARGSRPDLGFEVIELSTRFNGATYEDLLKMEEDSKLIVPNLDGNKDWTIQVSTDSSWANHTNKANSMSGHVTLLVGEEGRTV